MMIIKPKKNGPVDKDGFELLLRECISAAFGEVFTATKVDISFPKIEGKEICLVGVRPSFYRERYTDRKEK